MELCNPVTPQRHKGSAERRALLIARAADDAAEIREDSVVSSNCARWAIVTAAAALGILVAPFAASPNVYALSWARLFHPWGNYDAAANLYFEVAGGISRQGAAATWSFAARPLRRDGAAAVPKKVMIERNGAHGDRDAPRHDV